jgi:hypothetical protein
MYILVFFVSLALCSDETYIDSLTEPIRGIQGTAPLYALKHHGAVSWE